MPAKKAAKKAPEKTHNTNVDKMKTESFKVILQDDGLCVRKGSGQVEVVQVVIFITRCYRAPRI